MRSFAQGRVAFAAFRSLLVLSGVFALMKRDTVLAIGGFLTKKMRSKVGIEYCGAGVHTVCEDMEIVVRLHRYLLDKKLPGRICILPFFFYFTESTEIYTDIGKQRSRWYRGLLEVRRDPLQPRLPAIPRLLAAQRLARLPEGQAGLGQVRAQRLRSRCDVRRTTCEAR